jgi:hypothetical protein
MIDEILSYREMCNKENVQTLQRGMNFRLNPNYSVILMSQRKNAPYRDKILEDGVTIEYEGHDTPKVKGIKNPKHFDQPLQYPSGQLSRTVFLQEVWKPTKAERKNPNVSRYMKKFYRGYGRSKEFLIWWIIESWKTASAKPSDSF